MKRRLAIYRTANNSEIAEKSIQDFFRENQVQVFEKDASAEPDFAFNSIKIYIERMEKPINFLSNDFQGETKRKIQVKFDLMQQQWLA